jgi:cellulose synthase/poly-beta-1,6-N-acetylglucosamine synthase-like glycosyltransferase
VSVVDWWSLLSVFAFESLSLAQQIILILSVIISGLLGIYAVHAWMLTLLAFRRRPPPAVSSPDVWPSVSVHLPVYNERRVISRLLDSVLAFDYPRDKLEVIVVDDSTDDTTELVQSYQRRHPELVTVIHRKKREGFKAGALQTALDGTKGELFVLFDADHMPSPDFLQRIVPYLSSDKMVAFAQVRQSYLHDAKSWVTRALGLGTDAYAFVDQEARFSADLLTHFGGSGGVFRRTAVMAVGGWSSQTLAEDLDLSIRLRLRGWRWVYDRTIECPGELPASFKVLRGQQFRWASGFAGCLSKHLRSLITTDQLSLIQKLEALIYLSGYAASPLIAIGVVLAFLYCLVFPLDFILNGFWHNALAASTVVMSALIYTAPLAMFGVAVYRSTNGWSRRMERVLDLIYLGVLSVGIFLTSARAVVDGFLNRATYFYETPKHGSATMSQKNV